MKYHIVLYSPDRGIVHDGRTPDERGIGGGITARVALLAALARQGHRVSAVVNCSQRAVIDEVEYIPLDEGSAIRCDVLIATATGGDLSFAPLESVAVDARLRLLWVMGTPQPDRIDLVQPDAIIAASNFLRDVIVGRWGQPHRDICVIHHGLHQARFTDVEAHPPRRDPYALVYLGHPSKGLDAAAAALRRLRIIDTRYHLDVYGGDALWSATGSAPMDDEPGVRFMGLVGQQALIPRLYEYGFCLALQAMEEGFSIAVQEAKRAGVIVIANSGSSFPEAIRNGIDGFLIHEPHDSAACHQRAVELILNLVSQPEQMERIRQAARQTPWDWDILAQTWTAYIALRLGDAPTPSAEVIDGAALARFPDGWRDLASGRFFPSLPSASAQQLQPINTTKRVLIAGYYGFGNMGDEAILSALLDQLRACAPDVLPVVVSGSPDETSAAHGVDAVRWNDIRALTDAAHSADRIILGGGGLFHDYWQVSDEHLLMPEHRGIAFFTAFPLLAALFDKPLMIYAVGVGPLYTDTGRLLTRTTFEQAQIASVRDADSLALVRNLGISSERISLSADPIFTLAVDAPRRTPNPRLRLGAAVREWNIGVDQAAWMEKAARALDHLADQIDVEIVFLAFQTPPADERTPSDADISAEVAVQMRHSAAVKTPESPRAMLEALASCDLVLGMRLHSILLAARLGVPSVGLIYDPKVASAMRDLGIEAYAHDLTTLDADALTNSLLQAFQRRTDLAQTIRQQTHTLMQRAAADRERLCAFLYAAAPIHTPTPGASGDLRRTLRRYLRRSSELLPTEHRLVEQAAALLAVKDRDLLALLRQTADAQAALQEAQAQNAALQDENAALHTHNVTLQETLDAAQREWAALDAQRQTLEAQLSALDTQFTDLTGRFVALSIDHFHLTHQSAEQSAQLAQARSAVQHFTTPDTSHAAAAAQWARLTLRDPRAGGRQAAKAAYHLAVPLQLRLMFRTYRQRQPEIAAFARSPLRSSARFMYHLIIPLRYRVAFKRLRAERRMSWYAYAFDRFKRARSADYDESLAGIATPGERGMVSVVLPAYNGEDMIAEAVESILRQTYAHFELIIINDGSTDRTGAIADAFAQRDSRIRVIHQENRKIPRTLSRGFHEARGEFLTWTSCDNRMKRDCLQRLTDCLKRNPTWDMVYANLDIIGDDGRPLRGSPWYQGYQRPPGSEHVHLPETTDELNVWANNFIGAAFMYRSRVAYLIGDYSRHRFTTEDYDYWMQINALGTLRHADFDQPIYEYRFHAKSLTSRDKELGITRSRERLMVFDEFRRDFYLSPLIWRIDGSDSLRERIRQAQHIVLDAETRLDRLPPLWTPMIYVRFGAPDAASLPDLPPFAFTALVIEGDQPLPPDVSAAWGCCIALDARADAARDLPRLSQPHQGWLRVASVDDLFHALDIRAKQHHLRLLEAEIESPTPPRLRASVIICTHRFNQRLVNAVRSLAAQTTAPDEFEVIVVNNNPRQNRLDEAIADLRQRDFGGSARLRLIDCPIPGLSTARNAGIAAAQGEIICFIDDDAEAAPDWLEHIVRSYAENEGLGVVGGYIALKVPQARPFALAPGLEKYWSQFSGADGNLRMASAWYDFPWGANWTARRSALLRAGGFRTRYGRKGDDFGGGEEIAAAAIIQRLGWQVGIQPSARVRHDVDPDRYTLRHLRQTILAGHLSQYQLQRDLIIPMETNLRSTLHLLRRVNFDPALPRRSWIAWVDLLARKRAQVALLVAQLRDLRARFRRPVVQKES
jgi:polysaccharide pyruvyl transferase CsaB